MIEATTRRRNGRRGRAPVLGGVVRKLNEIADQNSCLNKAADDEPIFVLRANDEAALATIRH